MSTTILSHHAARLPIASTLVMIYGSYEVHRIFTGTHPTWSPRLEAAGITSFKKGEDGAESTGETGGVSDTAIRWTNVNGIPIPTLAAFMGTSREE
jgi:hypothetical protein